MLMNSFSTSSDPRATRYRGLASGDLDLEFQNKAPR